MSTILPLEQRINHFFDHFSTSDTGEIYSTFLELRDALDRGAVRAAEEVNGVWVTRTWVKKGILLGFKIGHIRDFSHPKGFPFFDKETWPPKEIRIENHIRVVPGGSSIRSGSFIAADVVIMPPSFINVGGYVDSRTMIDSHVLVGSCAQIGKGVHLSAGVQIGGVLEPVGARPVIIEDGCFVGGNCGIYEGTLVQKGAVLATGVILNRSVKLFDLPRERVITADEEGSLVIPENAVVVAGSRKISGTFAQGHGLALYSPIIIKYRDSKTSQAVALEEALRF